MCRWTLNLTEISKIISNTSHSYSFSSNLVNFLHKKKEIHNLVPGKVHLCLKFQFIKTHSIPFTTSKKFQKKLLVKNVTRCNNFNRKESSHYSQVSVVTAPNIMVFVTARTRSVREGNAFSLFVRPWGRIPPDPVQVMSDQVRRVGVLGSGKGCR